MEAQIKINFIGLNRSKIGKTFLHPKNYFGCTHFKKWFLCCLTVNFRGKIQFSILQKNIFLVVFLYEELSWIIVVSDVFFTIVC
jgi:hypothetical protein